MQPPCVPETRILRPRPASLTNSDDWPEFELTDTRVVSPGTNEPVSLFYAAEQSPLIVTGTLQPLTSHISHCYQRGAGGTQTVNIELNNVLQFAYGQYTNGRPVVWAAGQAGWYTIAPSRAYRPIYNEMSRAVSILYFVADAYRNSPKMTTSELFELYAQEVLKKPKATSEGAQEVYRHRDFLLACMIGGKEDLAWSRLSLYSHLQHKFPGDFAAVKTRLAITSVKTKKGSRPSSDADSTTSSKRRKGRQPKGQDINAISVDSSINSVSISRRCAKGRDAAATATARNTRHRSRPDAVVLPEPEHPMGQEPITPLQEGQDEDDDILETSDSDIGLLGARRAHKGQSALRPKASKASKGRKGPPKDNNEDDNDANETNALSTKSRKRKSTIPHRRSKRHLATDNEGSSDDDDDDHSGTGASLESSPISSPDANAPLSSTTSLYHLKESRDPIQDETFLCPLIPCTHKIFDINTPLAQRLIDEHLTSHRKATAKSRSNSRSGLNPIKSSVDDDHQRIQLVRRLQAPSLPAGRLMQKVLGVHNGASATSGEGMGLVEGSRVAGTRFPSSGVAVGQGVVVRY
ncbi:Hypothetical protein R9X50_00212100 [Acrodontium crateriforme]|uniref:RFTS domain-containing protein n=1 Tax=Acrodontium crateriforme TaxID=150365 RepID=A0AAQ3R6D3_9PEZI|nr:Hypothetical protein R9X50_00212100 [Acrodontium crateriforme]